MSVTLYRLQAFCVVVDHQSIRRAAERLLVTQPVVTRLVGELERHYGAQLLVRGRRSVAPTEAGLAVYRYARDVLQASEDTERLVAALVHGDSGVLTIGVTTAIGSYSFPSAWRSFWHAHPHTELVLRLGDSQRILEDARDGLIDLGLIISLADAVDTPPAVVVESLGAIETVLVAPAGHPLAARPFDPHELVGQTILCPNGASSYRIWEQTLEAWGISRGCKIVRFGDTETVKRGVEVGLGLGHFSRLSVGRELDAGALTELRVQGPQLQRELRLVQRENRPGAPLVAAFVEFLRGPGRALLAASG
jgi:LysR family transcriptional regulator, transcriptional activator of the cysJI operon